MKHPPRFLWALLPVTLLAIGLIVGCSDTGNETVMAPQAVPPITSLTIANPMLQSAIAVQERHTPSLKSDASVVGTAVGLNDIGAETAPL